MKKLSEYFFLHPIFHIDEIKRDCYQGKAAQTALTALYRAQKVGYIRRLKKGLYQVKSPGLKNFSLPHPLMVASRLAPDAILSHHSAFDALGASHSVFERLATYWTASPRHALKVQGTLYQPLLHPQGLRKAHQEEWGIEKIRLGGIPVRITGRERTFIDGFQGLRWVGGWDELCHCVDKFSHLNIKKLLEYALLLQSPALLSRLGFFLETNRERFYVDEEALKVLKEARSSNPVPFLMGNKSQGEINLRWNVVVPRNIVVALKELT